MAEREQRIRRRKFVTRWMHGISCVLPLTLRKILARYVPRLGFLLAREGDLQINHYLGSLSIVVNANSGIGREVLSGIYEKDLQHIIRKYVKLGSCCIDAGANIGTVSLALCKQVGHQGRVICFEPGPPFFKRLVTNVSLNPQFSSVAVLENLGLSDHEGECPWIEDPEFPGNAWLWDKTGTTVRVVTLDEYLANHSVDRVDFMKIDVEGMELEVVKGAISTLGKHHPVIALETLMDFEIARKQPIRRELQDFLAGLGYKLYNLNTDEALTEVRYPDFSMQSLALC